MHASTTLVAVCVRAHEPYLLARPIYIYHKDTTSEQYESALNDSMEERVDGEMVVYPDRRARASVPAYGPSVAIALAHRPRAQV